MTEARQNVSFCQDLILPVTHYWWGEKLFLRSDSAWFGCFCFKKRIFNSVQTSGIRSSSASWPLTAGPGPSVSQLSICLELITGQGMLSLDWISILLHFCQCVAAQTGALKHQVSQLLNMSIWMLIEADGVQWGYWQEWYSLKMPTWAYYRTTLSLK